MTTEAFENAVREMRKYQRFHGSASYGSPQKNRWLRSAQQWEAAVDKYLREKDKADGQTQRDGVDGKEVEAVHAVGVNA